MFLIPPHLDIISRKIIEDFEAAREVVSCDCDYFDLIDKVSALLKQGLKTSRSI